MAITVELHKKTKDVMPVYKPGTSMWEFNKNVAEYLRNEYMGFVYEDEKILYAATTSRVEVENNLEEVVRHAIAFRYNQDPEGVHLEDEVRLVMVDENDNASLLHNYNYYSPSRLPDLIHATNIESYATMHRSDPRLSDKVMMEMINGNENMDSSKPIDYFRNSVPRFSNDVDAQLTGRAMKNMKESQALEIARAEPKSIDVLNKKHAFEKKLFNFQVRENREGHFDPQSNTSIEAVQADSMGKQLKESFMDYASASHGKDWRHTFKDGANQLETTMVLVPKTQLRKKPPYGMQLSEASLAVVERQIAREEAARQAEKQSIAMEKERAQRAALTEHNSIFTIDHMWKVLDENRELGKTQPRDFFEHTKNHATQYSFLSAHSAKSTGEYRAVMTKDNPDNFSIEQVGLANDLAYKAMKQTHKQQLHNTHGEDRPMVEAQISFEEALFSYQEDCSNGLSSDLNAVHDKFVAFQELSHNRKIEQFQELVKAATPTPQAEMKKAVKVEKSRTSETGEITGSLEKDKIKSNIHAMRLAYH